MPGSGQLDQSRHVGRWYRRGLVGRDRGRCTKQRLRCVCRVAGCCASHHHARISPRRRQHGTHNPRTRSRAADRQRWRRHTRAGGHGHRHSKSLRDQDHRRICQQRNGTRRRDPERRHIDRAAEPHRLQCHKKQHRRRRPRELRHGHRRGFSHRQQRGRSVPAAGSSTTGPRSCVERRCATITPVRTSPSAWAAASRTTTR